MKVKPSTRKNLVDWLVAEGVSWAGRLPEEAFLERFVDLDTLASTDPRFESARQDIWQHRVNNDDWDNDWVYSYAPLRLKDGEDRTFLAFLSELLHPIVRPDSDEARSLARELNDMLSVDDIELFETGSIGDRPVWSTRPKTAVRDRIRPPLAPPVYGAADNPERIWRPGAFRLFLSHVSAHKALVSKLKTELSNVGISAFVAHEDIEPSAEWQAQIEVALRSMHAMAALITPDFHTSKWTDQEVGFALGRGTLVIPVRFANRPIRVPRQDSSPARQVGSHARTRWWAHGHSAGQTPDTRRHVRGHRRGNRVLSVIHDDACANRTY